MGKQVVDWIILAGLETQFSTGGGFASADPTNARILPYTVSSSSPAFGILYTLVTDSNHDTRTIPILSLPAFLHDILDCCHSW